MWKNETLAEQNKLPPTAKPVLLSKDIEMKIAGLDREVQYLLNKAKFTKPKKRENATGSPENGKTAPPKQETREGEQAAWQVFPASGFLDWSQSSLRKPSECPLLDCMLGDGGRAAFTAERFLLSTTVFFLPRADRPEDASPAKEPPTEEETPLDNELDPDGGKGTLLKGGGEEEEGAFLWVTLECTHQISTFIQSHKCYSTAVAFTCSPRSLTLFISCSKCP